MLHDKCRWSAHLRSLGREPVDGYTMNAVTHGQCDVRPTVTFPATGVLSIPHIFIMTQARNHCNRKFFCCIMKTKVPLQLSRFQRSLFALGPIPLARHSSGNHNVIATL